MNKVLIGWLTNRVLWGLVVFFVVVGFWEFKWKPQYRPYYEQGIADYQHARYPEALREMQRAYNVAPNSSDVIMMMGWINLKLKRYEEARFYFQRVLRIDPRIEEAQMGAAFVSLETGRGELSSAVLEKVLGERQGDPNVRILQAGALAREGHNWQAAAIYAKLVDDKNYGKAAQLALSDMFGLKGFDDAMPSEFRPLARPGSLRVPYRAGEGALWRMGPSGWEKFYVTGIDLGPGAPGYYPSGAPDDGQLYSRWLDNIVETHAQVVRAYTLLPPAFYRAFQHQGKQGRPLALFQQVWVGDPPAGDLYNSAFVDETRAEIRYVVDAIHGHGDVPVKRARASGIFDQDVSARVAGILFGRELEPSVVQQTNTLNVDKTRYDGTYLSIDNASPTEVWLAEMLDYLVSYETSTYNWQHPVALVNWPPLDPLYHPTEASTYEEFKLRLRRGEKLKPPSGPSDDADSFSIDEAKFRVKPAFQAGLFASYHVYPYYPDFLVLDPQYLKAHDQRGPDPMFAYLRELRAHIPYPLIVTEYGIPDSLGISHFQPYGWNHGGHTEQEQADILAQMTAAIRDAGCAGGLVFELQDEWYKHNWLTVDFEAPLDRAALWQNELDPEKFYGLIGYRTRYWKLFAGDADAWEQAKTVYSEVPLVRKQAESSVRLRSLQAAADEAFLYLRLNLSCPDCARRKKSGAWPLGKTAFAVALQTLPGYAGIKQMPFGVSLPAGADFLLYLGSPASTRLLVANNYNPYQIVPAEGVPGQTDIIYKRGLGPKLENQGSFEEFVVETNRRRWGRDGTIYPAQRYSRSLLRYGSGNPAARDYDSLAEWYLEPSGNAILVRLAWGKLLVTSPSDRQVFAGIDSALHIRTAYSPGVQLTVFQLQSSVEPGESATALDSPATGTVVASAPALVNQTTQPASLFTWEHWDKVNPDSYFKKAFYAIQKAFLADSTSPGSAAGAAVRRAGRRGRQPRRPAPAAEAGAAATREDRPAAAGR